MDNMPFPPGRYRAGMRRREFLKALTGLGAGAGLTLGFAEGQTMDRGSERTLPKRRLGRTEHYSSVVAFGGIALAALTLEEARREVLHAFEEGINHFDVAPSYGDAESKLGPALEGIRDKVFLACKTLARDRQGAEKELNESLARLRTDAFDLYQFHALDTMGEVEAIFAPGGAMEAVLAAREAGKLRFVGITGHCAPVQAQALRRFQFDTVMVPVDFVDRFYFGAETGLLALAHEQDVGVIAIKSTYRGAVADKLSAYRYTLSLPVSTTIPAGKVEEIRLATEIAKQFQPMSAEEMAALLRDSPELGDQVCRQCLYCMPCPKGVDVPLILALEGYGKRYRRGDAPAIYGSLPVSAAACVDCTRCNHLCPYHIDIVAALHRAHQFLSKAG